MSNDPVRPLLSWCLELAGLALSRLGLALELAYCSVRKQRKRYQPDVEAQGLYPNAMRSSPHICYAMRSSLGLAHRHDATLSDLLALAWGWCGVGCDTSFGSRHRE